MMRGLYRVISHHSHFCVYIFHSETVLNRQSTLMKTPRKSPATKTESTVSEGDDYLTQRSPAHLYSNMLCAVIEDFQV